MPNAWNDNSLLDLFGINHVNAAEKLSLHNKLPPVNRDIHTGKQRISEGMGKHPTIPKPTNHQTTAMNLHNSSQPPPSGDSLLNGINNRLDTSWYNITGPTRMALESLGDMTTNEQNTFSSIVREGVDDGSVFRIGERGHGPSEFANRMIVDDLSILNNPTLYNKLVEGFNAGMSKIYQMRKDNGNDLTDHRPTARDDKHPNLNGDTTPPGGATAKQLKKAKKDIKTNDTYWIYVVGGIIGVGLFFSLN